MIRWFLIDRISFLHILPPVMPTASPILPKIGLVVFEYCILLRGLYRISPGLSAEMKILADSPMYHFYLF